MVTPTPTPVITEDPGQVLGSTRTDTIEDEGLVALADDAAVLGADRRHQTGDHGFQFGMLCY